MSRIKISPSQAAKIKLNHFSNIGVIEIFLESVPSTFILVLLSVVGFSNTDNSAGLCNVLIGHEEIDIRPGYIDYWSFTLLRNQQHASVSTLMGSVSRGQSSVAAMITIAR